MSEAENNPSLKPRTCRSRIFIYLKYHVHHPETDFTDLINGCTQVVAALTDLEVEGATEEGALKVIMTALLATMNCLRHHDSCSEPAAFDYYFLSAIRDAHCLNLLSCFYAGGGGSYQASAAPYGKLLLSLQYTTCNTTLSCNCAPSFLLTISNMYLLCTSSGGGGRGGGGDNSCHQFKQGNCTRGSNCRFSHEGGGGGGGGGNYNQSESGQPAITLYTVHWVAYTLILSM